MKFKDMMILFDKIMNDEATIQECSSYFNEINKYEHGQLIHNGIMRNWSKNQHKELVKEITQ